MVTFVIFEGWQVNLGFEEEHHLMIFIYLFIYLFLYKNRKETKCPSGPLEVTIVF